MVILITGKAGAGKTYYAQALRMEKQHGSDRPIAWIDGDIWRAQQSNTDYSNEGRERNLLDAAKKAAELESQGMLVICSFIAPRKVWRNMMRKLWQESMVIYIPGGTLWEGTTYEIPDFDELMIKTREEIWQTEQQQQK